VPTQQALRHLDKAVKNLFDGRAKDRKFKKKHGRQSAEYTSSAFTWDGKHLTLAKMPEPPPIRWSRLLPEGAHPTTITLSRDPDSRYFASFLVEEELQPLPASPLTVGIDLGMLDVITLSTGEKTGNERFFRQEQKRLARLQPCNAAMPRSARARRTERRRAARWPGSMPASPTAAVIFSTS
jgi:putative transposase